MLQYYKSLSERIKLEIILKNTKKYLLWWSDDSKS